MRGQTRWYKHCKDAEDKQEFQKCLAEAKRVLKVLEVLLKESKELAERDRNSKSNYDLASWPYFQADKIGEIRTYTKILKLIKEFT